MSRDFVPRKVYIKDDTYHGQCQEMTNMAALDWSQCQAVESTPGKLSGAWVFKGTRMPVSLVFENLEAGATIEEIMDWFHLTRDQIVEVLEFAARSLDRAPTRPPHGTASAHERPI